MSEGVLHTDTIRDISWCGGLLALSLSCQVLYLLHPQHLLFGRWAFSVTGGMAWNTLLDSLNNSTPTVSGVILKICVSVLLLYSAL